MENYQAINWDRVSDAVDKATWEKLTEQFWLDTRVPVSNDMDDWRELDNTHQWVVGHVFGGLTLLDTVQSQDGMRALTTGAITPHEKAVLNNIQFMESVHAKSYSTIFSTLNTQPEIDEIFQWSLITNCPTLKSKNKTTGLTTCCTSFTPTKKNMPPFATIKSAGPKKS